MYWNIYVQCNICEHLEYGKFNVHDCQNIGQYIILQPESMIPM